MISSNPIRRCWLPALLAQVLIPAAVLAQGAPGAGAWAPRPYGPNPGPQPNAIRRQSPGGGPQRLAERSLPARQQLPSYVQPARPGEHPLMPALRWAREGLKNAGRIQDYSATLVKRERIKGKLTEYRHMFLKIRHKPFSVYMCFLGPPALKGREVIYVEGRNNGKMWARGTGWEAAFGTVSLDPKGAFAMRGELYPITEIGILNMVYQLVKAAEADSKFGECEVKFYKGAKVNDRVCTCIEVIHPVPRRNFLFHKAHIFVDDELNVVIRYASWDWPKRPGAEPELLEEYSYLNMKLNNGFTDADFDIRNPNYGFK